MSNDWTVLPLNPDDQETLKYLQSEGLSFPLEKGRFPTLDELTNVLGSLGKYKVEKAGKNEPFSISLGSLKGRDYALMLGRITDGGYYEFSFWGWRNKEITMGAILKKLSVFCGPLVLLEDYGGTPVIFTPDTDINQALQDWKDRIDAKFPEELD